MHVRESYSSLFVIHSFTLSTADLKDGGLYAALREEELRLDDGLSPFNLPLFLISA